MLLLRRQKNRAGKLRVERTRQDAFARSAGAVPQFNTVRERLVLVGDDAQPAALGYALIHRGSLRCFRNGKTSVFRTAPTSDDTILMTQCDVPIRIFAGRRVIGCI